MPESRWSPSPLVAAVAVVGAIVLVAVVAGLWFRDEPSALDRFYELPEAEEVRAAQRGQIFREEPIDNQGTGAVAYRVLYRTVGVDGEPVAASGFVAWPSGPAPEGGFPIVAYGHPTVGLADDCAPSRADFGSVDRQQAIAFLEAGYAVAAADYPGLGPDGPHPYAVGETAGASVIDMVRAARHSAGDQLDSSVVGWGYSQGGQALLWARALVATDAPELDWRGTVALAPAVDLAAMARGDLGDVLAVAVAMGQETRGLDVEPLLTEAGRDTRDDLTEDCINAVIEASVGRDGAPVLVEGTDGWLDDLGRETPPVEGEGPALVLYGDADATVGTDAVAAWVAGGADAGVEGRVVPGATHGGLPAATAEVTLTWLLTRLAPPS